MLLEVQTVKNYFIFDFQATIVAYFTIMPQNYIIFSNTNIYQCIFLQKKEKKAIKQVKAWHAQCLASVSILSKNQEFFIFDTPSFIGLLGCGGYCLVGWISE